MTNSEQGYVGEPVAEWPDERLDDQMARIQQSKKELQGRLEVLQEVRYGRE